MRDIVILIFGLPIGAVVGGLLGRWAQKRFWLLHLPYEERVRALKNR